MIANMRVAEVNITRNVSGKSSSMLAERLSKLEEEVKLLKAKVAEDNAIVVDAISMDKSDFRVRCSSLETQLQEFKDEVKKGEAARQERLEALSAGVKANKDQLTLKADTVELEAARAEVKIKSDEFATLQLRIAQIEDAIREDEARRNKEEEEKTAKLMARIKEAEKIPEAIGKGKGKLSEESPAEVLTAKLTKAEKRRREPDYFNLSEEQIRRIRQENEWYRERERKRLKKKNKGLDMKWSKDVRKWVIKAADETDFHPYHRSSVPPKMVSGQLTKEYREKNLDAQWMYYWYILKTSETAAEDEDLRWHEWMEKEDPDIYQRLLDEADKIFNADLTAPAYEVAKTKQNADGTIDMAWIKSIITKAEVESGLKDENELKLLRRRVFSWLMVPKADQWGV